MRKIFVVAVAVLAAALTSSTSAAAAGGIYIQIDSIPGSVMTQDHTRWIEALTFQVGGQVVSAAAPYALTLPAGTKSVTFTKKTDAASAGLSAAYASKKELREVTVDIVHPNVDARGATLGPQSTLIHLPSPMTVSSFTSTGGVETVVLTLPSLRPSPASQEFGRKQNAPTTAPESRKR